MRILVDGMVFFPPRDPPRPSARRKRRRMLLLRMVSVIWLSGCAQRETAENTTFQATSGVPESVYFIRRGWHTDVGFPSTALEPAGLGGLLPVFPGARYLVFGFGDRHYVLAKDKNVLEMLRALFPGPGLILVTGLSATPEQAFGTGNVSKLRIAAVRASAIRGFVLDAFAPDPRSGLPPPYARGPYPGSLFYAAGSRYSLAYTCNTWTAEALRSGGLAVRPTGVLFSGQVARQVTALPEAVPATPSPPPP